MRLFEHGMNILIDTRQYYFYTLLLALRTKIGQVVYTCRIDERHFSHPYNAHFWLFSHPFYHIFKLVGNAEEVRTINFVYFYPNWNNKMFFMHIDITLVVGVYLIGQHLYLCRFCHTAHTKKTSNDQSNFDSYRQVEYHR